MGAKWKCVVVHGKKVISPKRCQGLPLKTKTLGGPYALNGAKMNGRTYWRARSEYTCREKWNSTRSYVELPQFAFTFKEVLCILLNTSQDDYRWMSTFGVLLRDDASCIYQCFYNLKYLSFEGLRNLTSLEKTSINECENKKKILTFFSFYIISFTFYYYSNWLNNDDVWITIQYSCHCFFISFFFNRKIKLSTFFCLQN